MRPFQSLLLTSVGLALLAGCASHDITYERFSETQTAWPTSPSGVSHKVDGVEIFDLQQYPSQPYEVVGKVQIAVAYGYNTLEQEEQKLARLCKSHHADAALLQKTAVTKDIGVGYEYWIVKFKSGAGTK